MGFCFFSSLLWLCISGLLCFSVFLSSWEHLLVLWTSISLRKSCLWSRHQLTPQTFLSRPSLLYVESETFSEKSHCSICWHFFFLYFVCLSQCACIMLNCSACFFFSLHFHWGFIQSKGVSALWMHFLWCGRFHCCFVSVVLDVSSWGRWRAVMKHEGYWCESLILITETLGFPKD